MLADLAGDDVYESLNVSQGAGHVGVGVLWDAAETTATSRGPSAKGPGSRASASSSTRPVATCTGWACSARGSA